jgi:DNA end-binding protein Ku
MPRPIWSGSISFGLVNVPVRLITAQSPKDVRFNQLHDGDGGRIQQKRVCSVDGEEVPYEQIVKGYEIGSGQYVIIKPEELASLDPVATHTIDLEEFVDLEEIDPILFERSYYLVPDKRAEKPYALLVEAMASTGKVGLGRFVMRTKQYLAALRAKDKVLVLSTMLYADEVLAIDQVDGVPGDEIDITDRELAMAEQLVSTLTTDFDLAKYKDDYRDRVMELIEAKSQGLEVVAPPVTEAATPVVDLMAALEASLAAAKTRDATPAAVAAAKGADVDEVAEETAPKKRRRSA